ncbi:MAG: exo-alpha-sialidase, partial [Acidobacteria bacterium]|nr:exo-alpha-sialidase [Acidobacteriota bacterium]
MLHLTALLLAVHIAPGGANLEYRQPQLAADSRMVALTFGSGHAVYFAASFDQGKTFSAPVKVAEAGKMALGRHRGPRIALTPSSIVISAVVGEKGGGADGDVLAWRSIDGGKSWSAGVPVNDVPAAAREGLHAMAAGGGVVFATWLDLRSKGTRLYGAHSKDGGATWSANVLVYESPEGKICECCHPSAMVDSKGVIYAMWRNNLAGSRDMYVARSTDGGHTFSRAEKAGTGTWVLNACPMDGGGLALGPDGKVVSAWRRG